MTKITVFGNYSLYLNALSDGYKCNFAESDESFTLLNVRAKSDIIALKETIAYFNSKGKVKILCRRKKERSDETHRGAYLSSRHTRFLLAYMKNPLPKGVCIDVGISRSTYYRMLEEVLETLSLRSGEQLRMWGLYHLSV